MNEPKIERTVSIDDYDYVWVAFDKCITRVKKGSESLPMPNGQGFYRWQFYPRKVLYDPRALSIITEDFFNRFEGLDWNRIRLGGTESSAVPLLTAFSQEAHRRGFMLDVVSVRKAVKEYGLHHWVEGKINHTKPVMIVDDLISFGLNNMKTADTEYRQTQFPIWSLHSRYILENSGVPVIKDVMYAPLNKNNYYKLTEKSTHQGLIDGEVCKIVSMFDLQDFELHNGGMG